MDQFELQIDLLSPPYKSRHESYFKSAVVTLGNLFITVHVLSPENNNKYKVPLCLLQQRLIYDNDYILYFKSNCCWRLRTLDKQQLILLHHRFNSLSSSFSGTIDLPNLIQFSSVDSSFLLISRNSEFENLSLGQERIDLSNAFEMFKRMNIPGSRMRITSANKNFCLSDILPEYFIVPAAVDDVMVASLSKYRVKVPHLVYFHSGSDGILCRSSQPLVGTKMKRSIEDEHYISLLLSSNQASFEKPCLVDTRTKVAASSSKIKGGGTEAELSCYTGIRLFFTNIETPDNLREIYSQFIESIKQHTESSITSYLGDSGPWFRQIQSCLKPSLFIADNILNGTSVLVHCDEGLDTSSIVVSLVKLILSPFYRTIQGFSALIKEDWLDEGFRFSDRCSQSKIFKPFSPESDVSENAHSASESPPSNSPIFMLFLDCAYQLWHQNPTEFEFIVELLLLFNFHTFSCQFGTFLLNSEKERIHQKIPKTSYSFWNYLEQPKINEKLKNDFYQPNKEKLDVSFHSKRIIFFSGLYDSFDANNSYSQFYDAVLMENNSDFSNIDISNDAYRVAKRKIEAEIENLESELSVYLKDNSLLNDHRSKASSKKKDCSICGPLCICELKIE